ncbi:Alkaline phosphatase, tissue-nonspecific isozyme [Papilio machaon]|uniref:Alkaline phosphatase n=1 Tax=Papilio machaon TaxID=76193 RepID=A0A0N1ICQ2_PAPMA|nr:Alkaline phosphatase, tissue-nonspecific isozyme [Papilio machaon]
MVTLFLAVLLITHVVEMKELEQLRRDDSDAAMSSVVFTIIILLAVLLIIKFLVDIVFIYAAYKEKCGMMKKYCIFWIVFLVLFIIAFLKTLFQLSAGYVIAQILFLDQKYWKSLAEKELEEALQVRFNLRTAKNVILFVGDGMGPNTVTAARIYRGGESHKLAFEAFPHVGLLKTYSADKMVPDSACSATALFSGIKANLGTLGVDATVPQSDCEASLNKDAWVDSLAAYALKAGKSSGLVTTMRVTHATPAPLYAHSASRSWECEANMPANAKQCKDIARQLVEDWPGRDLHVEGGKIDMAHHRGRAKTAVDETVAMERAVQVAVDMTSDEDTLIIVTSDHTHTLTINGYPERGSSVFGIAGVSPFDRINYTTLSYGAGGPGSFQYDIKTIDNKTRSVRREPSKEDTESYHYEQIAAIPLDENSHGGGDVAVYAKGPHAHLFHSVHEQHYVFQAIAYAAKIGPYSSGYTIEVNIILLTTAVLLLIKLF